MNKLNKLELDKVVCIRTKVDDKQHDVFLKSLESLGFNQAQIIAFPSVEMNNKEIAKLITHSQILNMAESNNWGNCLIIEDDVIFNQDLTTRERLDQYLDALEHLHWDVAFLTANYGEVLSIPPVSFIKKINRAWCACAYIVNKLYFKKLLNHYLTCLYNIKKRGLSYINSLDQAWHQLMKEDSWYGVYPTLGYKHIEKSDSHAGLVDEKNVFFKPLELIEHREASTGRKNKPIKIDFHVQYAPGWTNHQSIYDLMCQDSRFDCQIVVIPHLNVFTDDLTGERLRKFFDERGYSWIGYELYSMSQRQPDIVFLQKPYDDPRPPRFSAENIVKHNIDIAYVPYGLDVGGGQQNFYNQYNMPCHNLARWIFVRSERHKEHYGKYCDSGNHHVYVTGHPKYDFYESRFCSKENKKSDIKTLLWTPHFFHPEGTKMYTTFGVYVDAMTELMKRDDINIIIRPHPHFRESIRAFGGKLNEKFHYLQKFTQERNNVTWDFNADYFQSFKDSDALMADAGSFLFEYLPTKKPILYLTHESCLGLNSSGDFFYQACEVAWNKEAIFQFANDVVAGRDDKKNERLAALEKELYFSQHSAAWEITNIIINDYYGKEGEK